MGQNTDCCQRPLQTIPKLASFRMEWTGVQLHSKGCYALLITTNKNKDCINTGKVQTAENECQHATMDKTEHA